MSKISSYKIKNIPVGSDIVIGTSVDNGQTKNFSVNALSIAALNAYLSTNSFQFVTTPNSRPAASISFEEYGGDLTPFSSITSLYVNTLMLNGTYSIAYLNRIVGENILISDKRDLDRYGVFLLQSLTNVQGDIYEMNLEFIEGNSSLHNLHYYGLSIDIKSNEDDTTYSLEIGQDGGNGATIELIPSSGTTQSVTIDGVSNQTKITEDVGFDGTIHVGLADNVTINNDLTVGSNLIVARDAQFDGSAFDIGSGAFIDFGNNKITEVADPTNPQDAATKAYVDASTVGGLIYQGGYDAATNTPNLDATPIAGIKKGWTYTVTDDGLFFTEQVRVGDVLIAEIDSPTTLSDWTTVQNNIDIASDSQIGIGNVAAGSGVDVSYSNGTATVSLTDVGASNFVYFTVKNETGATIPRGAGVMAVGTDGNSGHILIDEFIADGSVQPKYFLGLMEDSIDNGAFGRAVSFGEIDQINTNAFNDGDVLWTDPAVPGGLTTTEPDGPNTKLAVAIVLNSSTNGKVFCRVQGNEGVHDLHDTRIISQVDGDVLVWNETDGVWFNDSTLNVDYTNGRVGIGTNNPSEKLTVDGNLKITGETFKFNFTGDAQHIFSIVPATPYSGLGSSSLKFGKNNSATKGGGIAMGQNLISTGDQSQAFGFGNNASGNQSTVFGVNTTATGDQSFAIGNEADATGGRAFAGGFNSTASGLNSVALGNATVASGTNAVTMGAISTASGFNSFALGLGLINSANASLAVGAYNVDSTEHKFSVGIGASTSNRANAMAINGSGYIILDALKNSSSYSSDAAAAAGGVPLGALYRDGNTVKIRLT